MRIDRTKSAVIYNGKMIPLSKYELLYFFAQNPRKVITRDSILHNIWGSDIYLLAKSVDTYINNICTKLNASVIARIKGNDYCLNLKALN